jgi:hypothetical protein
MILILFRKENACHLHNAFFLLAYEYLKCVHNGVYVFSIIRNKYPVSIQSKIIKIDSIGKYRFFFLITVGTCFVLEQVESVKGGTYCQDIDRQCRSTKEVIETRTTSFDISSHAMRLATASGSRLVRDSELRRETVTKT